MQGGFNGQYYHSVDDKGRVSIPARFRELLERDGDQVLFISQHRLLKQKCLALYPPREWERVLGRIREKNSLNPDVQAYQTHLLGNTHEVEVDKQGRILIPPHLREYGGIQREVTFQGVLDHFVLWDKATHAKFERAAEQTVTNPRFLERLEL